VHYSANKQTTKMLYVCGCPKLNVMKSVLPSDVFFSSCILWCINQKRHSPDTFVTSADVDFHNLCWGDFQENTWILHLLALLNFRNVHICVASLCEHNCK